MSHKKEKSKYEAENRENNTEKIIASYLSETNNCIHVCGRS